MATNQKDCPRCAETIKAAALVCKHCGYEFSSQEMAASQKDVECAEVDRLLREYLADYGKVIDEENCAEIAEEAGESPSLIKSRASKMGLKFDDDSSEFADEMLSGVITEAKRLAEVRPLNKAQIKYLSREYGYTERGALRRLVEANIAIDPQVHTHHTQAPTSGAGEIWSPHENQYGVLQGPANLVGGCATFWGWAILLFIIAAILAVVFG
jgi:hypothetical protein